MEYMLIKLRIASVSEDLELYFDVGEGESRERITVKLNLENVLNEIVENASIPDRVIQISDEVSVEMSPMSMDIVLSGGLPDHEDDDVFELLPILVKNVIWGESVISLAEIPQEEVDAFFSSFGRAEAQKLVEYFSQIPTMEYTVKYTDKDKKEHSFVLESVLDFFQ